MATCILTRCPSRCVLITKGIPTDCTQCDGPESDWRSARFSHDMINEDRIDSAHRWEDLMEEEPPIRCPICGQSCYNLDGHECPDPLEWS